jgi:O-antigen/teichoic acid export membrane protein
MTGARQAGWRVVAVLSSASVVQAGANTMAALWATRALGATSRGDMVLGLTLVGVVSLVAGVGSGAAYRAQLPQAGAHRQHLATAYTAISVVSSLVTAALAGAATVASADVIDPSLGAAPMVLAVMLSAFTQSLLAQTTDAWHADARFRRGARLAALAAAFGLVGLVAGGAVSPTAAAMLTGRSVAGLAVTVLSVVQLRAAMLLRFGRPARTYVRGLIGTGSPTLGYSLGFSIALRADRFVLGVVAGPVAVTVYSTAATVSELARMVPQAVGQLLGRRIAEGAAVRQARWVALAGGAVLASGAPLVLVSWWSIPVVFGPEILPARHYLVLLLVAEFLYSPAEVAARGLIGGGWTWMVGVIGCVGSVLAVSAYCLLIPRWEIWGAVVASCGTYLVLSVVAVTALRRRLGGCGGLIRRPVVSPRPPGQPRREPHGQGGPRVCHDVSEQPRHRPAEQQGLDGAFSREHGWRGNQKDQ